MEGFVKNLDIFMFMKTNSCFSQPDVLYQMFVTKFQNLSEEEQKKLKQFCQKYVSALKKNWISCNRIIYKYIKKYEAWLENDIKWPDFIIAKLTSEVVTDYSTYDVAQPSSSSSINEGASTSQVVSCSIGTSTSIIQRKPFVELSPAQKKRRVESLLAHDTEHLAFATALSCGNEDVAAVIKYIFEHPEKAADVKNMLKAKTTSVVKYSAEKALGILISLQLSKWQYTTLRKCAEEDGIPLYPAYNAILQAKKECYPPANDITLTETSVSVKLQAILDVTVTRLAKLLILDNLEGQDLKLICKWGFDGASSQSNYKQKISPNEDDSSIFMCSFVPLQLKNSDNTIWENPKPSSTMFCRPIYFKFACENKLNMKEEMGAIETEIEALVPSVIGNNINVTHSMLLTMIDGKVTSHLTETSMQTCDICKAVPSEMNDYENIKNKTVSSESYCYGLSTLHAWIRSMECLLHIAYRLDFKKWQARDDSCKAALKSRKQTIQQKFRDEMGLLIDIVKQGSGTTNDGNTARRFFQDPEKTASITGLSSELIRKFGTILRVLSSGYSLKIDTFTVFLEETAQLYVTSYGWYYMPASVHKMLLHGAEIVKHFNVLPIGKLSEEASEARNKDFKKVREHHTRKFCRKATNEDIFNNLLISSDPFLSSIRPVLSKKVKRQLSEDMLPLLVIDRSQDEENFEFVDVDTVMDSDVELSDDDENVF